MPTPDYMLDRDFLRELDHQRQRVLWAKIIALTNDEDPVEEIQGRITTGSINVDGNSAVRRTCSLTLAAKEFQLHDYYWGFNTKFRLFIGLTNTVNNKYPEIIWFKMGTFLISSFSTSQTLNNYSISIQGKDKMCRLNGDMGGSVMPLSWDFGQIETIQADGSKIIESYLIKNIIQEAVHEYAQEPWENIIIEDLDDLALELLEYRGDKTMYLLYDITSDLVVQWAIPDTGEAIPSELTCINGSVSTYEDIIGDPRVDRLQEFQEDNKQTLAYSLFKRNNATGEEAEHIYSYLVVEYGDTIGYRLTDLIYAGDLIANCGESVTSVLDKLVQMLGNYEYFYDVDGMFHFRRKALYFEASWNNIDKTRYNIDYYPVPVGSEWSEDSGVIYAYKEGNTFVDYYYYDEESWRRRVDAGEMYYYNDPGVLVENSAGTAAWEYNFEDDVLISSFNNNPNLLNLRNDYSIWGERTGVSGATIPVHLRYAIDYKPKYYQTFDGDIYVTEEGKEERLKDFDDYIKLLKYRESQQTQEPEIDGIFKKTRVPLYLQNDDGSSDWWDLLNWAEYYKLLSGVYPSEVLGHYGTGQGYRGTIVFPNGTSKQFWNQLIFDTDRTTHNPFTGEVYFHRSNSNGYIEHARTWSPFQHGYNSCFHTYEEFIELNTNYNMQSFIYKPKIPANVTPIIDESSVIIDDTRTELERAEDGEEKFKANAKVVDWRELIYQMELDYRKHNHDQDFHLQIRTNNLKVNGVDSYYPKGYTGYEPYYVDIEGFWRQLYDPNYDHTYQIGYLSAAGWSKEKAAYNNGTTTYYIFKQCEENATYDSSKEYYYYDYLSRFVRASGSTKMQENFANDPTMYWYPEPAGAQAEYDTRDTYYIMRTDEYDANTHWNKDVYLSPESLNFWFDFLDPNTDVELGKYAVQVIGTRPKAENDNTVKGIYFRDIPEVIFVDSTINDATLANQKEQRPGYEFVQLPGELWDLFSISHQGKSAFDKLDNFLYNYTTCADSITINSLPIYYLEPNTRIWVDDKNSGIHGEYLVTRLSIPLNTNGMMNITATKIIEKLY